MNRYASLDAWVQIIAVAAPMLPAAVLAWATGLRWMFWAPLAGAIVGLGLGTMESGTFDDPMQMLIRRTQNSLEGTIPGALIGVAVAVAVRKLSPSKNQE